MKQEKVIRFGAISASVFTNEIDTGDGNKTVRNVKLQRRYKSGNEWKTSTSFTLSDLPTAVAVLKRATVYVADMESDTGDGNQS